MKHLKTGTRHGLFSPLHATASVQSAMMVLRPGQDSGEFHNEHPRSEQWLFVISGTGRARAGKGRCALKAGSLLLIEKGEPHQISNTGRKLLVTLNLYVPPAYRADGEVRESAKS